MAGLPRVICLEAQPFIQCEIDMFGPYTVKERRSDLTDFVPYLHVSQVEQFYIEVSNGLDTDSFIFLC